MGRMLRYDFLVKNCKSLFQPSLYLPCLVYETVFLTCIRTDLSAMIQGSHDDKMFIVRGYTNIDEDIPKILEENF